MGKAQRKLRVGITLIWSGAQAPCATRSFNTYFSRNPTTAYSQGVRAADGAKNAAYYLGFSSIATVNRIYYDLEPFDTSSSSCVAAAKSYINGWDHELLVNSRYYGGLYGSTCASDLRAFASISNVPYDILPAYWNNSYSVYGLRCLPDSYWGNHQRIHQFRGEYNVTWGSHTLHIDGDCADADVARNDGISIGCE